MQDTEDRVIFVLPWLDRRFLIVGTTEVPQTGDPGAPPARSRSRPICSMPITGTSREPEGRPADKDVVWSFAGVRALQDDAEEAEPAHPAPGARQLANGTGGFVTLYGGKLTTHRAFAETVLDTLHDLGASMGGPWTKDVPLYGGCETRAELLSLVAQGPAASRVKPAIAGPSPMATRSKGFDANVLLDPSLAREIAPGVPLAELIMRLKSRTP